MFCWKKDHAFFVSIPSPVWFHFGLPAAVLVPKIGLKIAGVVRTQSDTRIDSWDCFIFYFS